MSKKATYYNQAIHLLQELKKLYPGYSMGLHLSMALAEYGDTWGLSDKELVFALEKHKLEMEMDIAPDKDLDKIIKDGEDLDKLFEEGDYE